MSNTANVAIFVPGPSVKSMEDELADGSVAKAVEAALAAYTGVDTDGDVPTREYSEDFDNAVTEAIAYAGKTDGPDLLVIVTDLECDDPATAERLLSSLTDDMVVIVPVSNQGYNQAWADKLDDDAAGPNCVDVVTVDGLADSSVALAEVGPFLERSGVNA